ncbi:MAG TPA: CopD family protein [Alphaproteobacteria bacterium]|nr:CopD family protein [Alphaproteobacteria bacterium]
MSAYLLFKALHLVAMVAWFAGLFYLPRLFVYMLEQPKAAPTLHIMAYKLSRYIMLPAAVATLVCGMGLLMQVPEAMQHGWLHAKLGLVLVLLAYQASLEYFRLQLAAGRNTKSARFFRMYNEVPTLLLIAIILLAVFKPF